MLAQMGLAQAEVGILAAATALFVALYFIVFRWRVESAEVGARRAHGKSPRRSGRVRTRTLRNGLLRAIEQNDALVTEIGGWFEVYAEQHDILRAKIRPLGRQLNSVFWETYGEALSNSGLLPNIIEEIRRYFAQVSQLQADINELSSMSSSDDLIKVLRLCAAVQQSGRSLRARIPTDFDSKL